MRWCEYDARGNLTSESHCLLSDASHPSIIKASIHSTRIAMGREKNVHSIFSGNLDSKHDQPLAKTIAAGSAPLALGTWDRCKQLMIGLSCALIMAALPAAASAQSCSTQVTSSLYASLLSTTCSDGSSSVTVCVGSSGCKTSVTPATQPAYVPPPTAPVSEYPPPPPPDQGMTLNMAAGGQKYLAPGTFVKLGDALAIYRVYGGQLHAFSTWPQFLNAGGNPDLSNVALFASITDDGRLYGSPVQ